MKTVQFMDKTGYLGCEESVIPCYNTVLKIVMVKGNMLDCGAVKMMSQ